MRRWESTLRREHEAWEDFKAWIVEIEQEALAGLMTVPVGDILYQRGTVDGIRSVGFRATANEREELSRARRQG